MVFSRILGFFQFFSSLAWISVFFFLFSVAFLVFSFQGFSWFMLFSAFSGVF